jgi:hypothetical protein
VAVERAPSCGSAGIVTTGSLEVVGRAQQPKQRSMVYLICLDSFLGFQLVVEVTGNQQK